MSIELLIVAILALEIATVSLFGIKKCYYPACFFVVKFLAARLIDFDRTRNNVAFQLAVIFFVFVVVVCKNSGKLVIHGRKIRRTFTFLLMFVSVNVVIGLLYGHNWFQVFIDAYKYIEIIVFFLLFELCWKDNGDLLRGLKSICYVMLGLGVLEIFLTSRGGVGLNLIMGFFPIIIFLAVYGYIGHYKIITALSLMIVFLCKTRTYMIAFMLGLILLLFLAPRDVRHKLTSSFLVIGIVAIITVGVFNIKLLSSIIGRFFELSAGFAESGGYRIDEYIVALRKFAKHPLIGNGFGYLEYTFINKMGWIYWGDFIHCVYIEILFKTGILGFGTLVAIVGNSISKIWHAMVRFKEKDNFMFAICCGGICSVVIWLLTYTFAPLTTYGSIFMGILTAGIAVTNHLNGNESPVPSA